MTIQCSNSWLFKPVKWEVLKRRSQQRPTFFWSPQTTPPQQYLWSLGIGCCWWAGRACCTECLVEQLDVQGLRLCFTLGVWVEGSSQLQKDSAHLQGNQRRGQYQLWLYPMGCLLLPKHWPIQKKKHLHVMLAHNDLTKIAMSKQSPLENFLSDKWWYPPTTTLSCPLVALL